LYHLSVPETLSLLLRTAVFTVFLPFLITVGGPYLLFGRLSPAPPPWPFFGIPVLAAGLAIYLWCAWNFIHEGRGTPAPYDPPRFLVRGGLYRFTRNPMYIGITSVLIGESLLFAFRRLALYSAAVFVVFHIRTVFYEEPTLRKIFGAPYEEYCRRVPRWLF
jgi:protein-S-isoprenylcysteine O-methyltransferase Ste14